jgi:hypothetical protein
MRKAPLLLPIVAILSSMVLARTASAEETIMLRAGEATGPNAVFAFDKKARPRVIVVRTTQVGVAGSRLAVSIDRVKTPVFSHIFTTEECKFGDGGSKCEVAIPASSPDFARILRRFRRGRLARVSILDAGVMKMDETVSLSGFTKAVRGL